jgi:lysozyme
MRFNPSAMKITAAAFAAVLAYEGYSSVAYKPLPEDVPTIGHGTTVYPDGNPVKLGDVITREEAKEIARYDIDTFANKISYCIKVPVAQYEYDAYVSLSYNIGTYAFCKSTLVKKLNTYDYSGACKEILRWDRFQGKPLRGLTIRRQKEFKTCIDNN